jgi:CubicO group peptidase (beta-lactamase class C family)
MTRQLQARIAELPELIGVWMEQADAPGLSVALIEADEVAWTAGFGVADAATRVPVTADTVFQAASLSKPVVAYAALREVDTGRLDLDQPLAAYLPEPYAPDVPQVQTITARQVLSHSSGLQNWRQTPEEPLQLAFEPGSGFRYSGEGYFLLQRVLEQLAGAPFEAFMQRALFQPLGMTRSTYLWTVEHAAWIAAGHRERGEPAEAWNAWQGQRMLEIAADWGQPLETWTYADVLRALPEIHPELTPLPNNLIPNAAGSLLTSAADYARFLLQLLRAPGAGPLPLSRPLHATMLTPQARLNSWLSWGLGWGVEDEAGKRLHWHWGDNMIFQSFVLAALAQRWGAIILTNSGRGLKVCERIITHLTGRSQAAFLWL